MNHITLETAKKLKKLGWKQGIGEYHWATPSLHSQDWACISTSSDYPSFHEVAAPTCEELLEVLPKMTDSGHLAIEYYNGKWGVDYRTLYYEEILWLDNQVAHEFITEALALLLIELVEQGIVDKDSLTDKK